MNLKDCQVHVHTCEDDEPIPGVHERDAKWLRDRRRNLRRSIVRCEQIMLMTPKKLVNLRRELSKLRKRK